MMHRYSFPLCVALCGLASVAQAAHPSSDYLWYRQPATVNAASVPWAAGLTNSGNVGGEGIDFVMPQHAVQAEKKGRCSDPWEAQSLPIGNGRVGGTVFGGDRRERINLNEISLWTGGFNAPGNGSGYSYGPTSGKDEFGSYQPFGNLMAEFDLPGETQDYSRSLDLHTAVARTEFTNGGVRHVREAFVSKPDDVLVYTATADKPGALSVKLGLTPCHKVSYRVSGDDTIIMRGELANGELFEGRMQVKVQGGGAVMKGGDCELDVHYVGKGDMMRPNFDAVGAPYVQVQNADSVAVYITLATDYKEDYRADWKGEDPAVRNEAVLAALAGKDVAAVRADHVADHKALFERMDIELGKSDADTQSLPTDVRIAKYAGTQEDPELEATIYQYGRYMLIAGSRPGNLPMTLQGIWNDKVHAPWACDYHNNINIQMCYWGAEVGNLSECHRTFIDYMKAMSEPLHAMTQQEFGADTPGWTTRISQNPWGGGGWVKWNPPVNAWYALHVWDHYQFTHDEQYLREVGYPLLKEISQFWEKQLKELGPNGEGLVTEIPERLDQDGKPKYAPARKGKAPNGFEELDPEEHPELKELPAGTLVSPLGWSHEWGPVEDGCMHDQQLIRELFDNTVKAARVLGVDADQEAKMLSIRNRLAPNRVAAGGYLQEWIVDRPDMVAGHRHTSHLIGVFPGSTITRERTPELAAAAMKSLELRGLSGDNRRSWTWPWRTALWARFGQTERAYEMVQSYILYNVLDNLFGNHPPMQMDGTFGMTGGMSEMLVQSHAGQIELLPALPEAWKDGHIRGIRARGNITIDMEWSNGLVTAYRLTTTTPNPQPVRVKVNGETHEVMPEVKDK
ncbi:MAG: glycoside hydrolase N-terminal domain-containing protein [Akkermansia sp.]|nr:glycoside hydrolase N-terminal domain-containing protein [Akkermansia sp.]